MNLILKIMLSAVAVLILAKVLPGVAVDNYISSLLVAAVLALLNTFLKPILVVLTLPATILTLGLFLLVINAAIILLADEFVSGFTVDGWLWALIFSVLLAVFQSILHSVLKKD